MILTILINIILLRDSEVYFFSLSNGPGSLPAVHRTTSLPLNQDMARLFCIDRVFVQSKQQSVTGAAESGATLARCTQDTQNATLKRERNALLEKQTHPLSRRKLRLPHTEESILTEKNKLFGINRAIRKMSEFLMGARSTECEAVLFS